MTLSLVSKFIEENVKEAERQYRKVVEYCKNTNTTFIDKDFPHTRRSYYSARQEFLWFLENLSISLYLSEKVTWTRPVLNPMISRDFHFKPWSVMDAPTPSEIVQRVLPDCGLIAALMSIAMHPEIVGALMPRKELSEYGVYQVRLCVDGEWKRILVDDWFPRFVVGLKGVFSNRNQLWPCLVEKAAAKLCGTYHALYGFDGGVAFQWITGAPTTSYNWYVRPEIVANLWDILHSSSLHAFPMTCGSQHVVLDEESSGICPGHMYSLLDALEVDGLRLVRIRNTFGKLIWKGKWSPTWDGWTGREDLQQELMMRTAWIDDSFWMEYDDFVKYFDQANVCRARPEWFVTRMSLVVDGNEEQKPVKNVLKVTVATSCDVAITAYRRGVRTTGRFPFITWVLIHSVKSDGEGPGELVSRSVLSRNCTEDIRLTAGAYFILLTALGTKRTHRNVALHSSAPCKVEMVSMSRGQLADSFQKLVLQYGHEMRLSRQDVSIKTYLSDDGSYMVIMAENYTRDKFFHVQ
ncbi:unnamed protein product [Caenorhabditis sp. 36 PRJEB53466]|nr:unnamed protein product [Caenorhabditis sp. 36 PRJEB53466]